jgi:hypothetical protein
MAIGALLGLVARGAARGAGGRAAAGRAAGRKSARSARFTRNDAATAREKIAQRGDEWRDAMQASGQNEETAREMISQRREQEREDLRREREQPGMLENLGNLAIGAEIVRRFNETANAPMRSIDRQTMLARDDYRGYAMSTMGEGGILGKYAAKLVDSMGKLTDAVEEKGKALSQYSGDLAQQTAMAQVRQMMADIREARTAGKAYGEVVEQSSKLQTELQEAFTPIKMELAKILTDILKAIRDGVEFSRPFLEIYASHLRLIGELLKAIIDYSPALRVARGVAEGRIEAEEEADKKLRKGWWDFSDLQLPSEPNIALPPDPAMAF